MEKRPLVFDPAKATLVALAALTPACAGPATDLPSAQPSAAGLYEAVVLKAVDEARSIREAVGAPLPARPALAIRVTTWRGDLVFPDQRETMAKVANRMAAPGAKLPSCTFPGRCTMDATTVAVTIGHTKVLEDGRYYVGAFFQVLAGGQGMSTDELNHAFAWDGKRWTPEPYVPEITIVI